MAGFPLSFSRDRERAVSPCTACSSLILLLDRSRVTKLLLCCSCWMSAALSSLLPAQYNIAKHIHCGIKKPSYLSVAAGPIDKTVRLSAATSCGHARPCAPGVRPRYQKLHVRLAQTCPELNVKGHRLLLTQSLACMHNLCMSA